MVKIYYTIVDSVYDKLIIAITHKGICFVAMDDDSTKLTNNLIKFCPEAQLIQEETKELTGYANSICDWLGSSVANENNLLLLPIDMMRATEFQKLVWNYLRTIPEGKTYYYNEVATSLGRDKATRAVARACASNPIALLIPCHRVVPKAGGIGGYRWQPYRKGQILQLEDKKCRLS